MEPLAWLQPPHRCRPPSRQTKGQLRRSPLGCDRIGHEGRPKGWSAMSGLDEIPTRELELLLASARDQYATAVNNWQRAVESDASLANKIGRASCRERV